MRLFEASSSPKTRLSVHFLSGWFRCWIFKNCLSGRTDGWFLVSTPPNARILRFPCAEQKRNYKIRIFGAGLVDVKVFTDYFFLLFLWPGTGSETVRPSPWKPPSSLGRFSFFQAPVFLIFWEKNSLEIETKVAKRGINAGQRVWKLQRIKRKILFQSFAASLFCSETERWTFSLPPQTFIHHIQSSIFTSEVCVPTVGARNEIVSLFSHRLIDSFLSGFSRKKQNELCNCTRRSMRLLNSRYCDQKMMFRYRKTWEL